MEHKPLIVEWLNRLLQAAGKAVGLRMTADPLPVHLLMAFIVTAVILVFFKLTVRKPSLFPGKMQYFLEVLYKFFRGIIDELIGPEGRAFIPAIGTLGLFIAVSNLIGLMPELGSPTANINVTAGCAVFVFLYYNYQGVKKHGLLGYLKTFMGPAWWLAWLMVPIEIISHFSRPLSLSVRLFGNIYGEDLVILILVSLVPFVAPLPMMIMAVFTSLIQAYVFMMLTTVYLAGATASEH